MSAPTRLEAALLVIHQAAEGQWLAHEAGTFVKVSEWTDQQRAFFAAIDDVYAEVGAGEPEQVTPTEGPALGLPLNFQRRDGDDKATYERPIECAAVVGQYDRSGKFIGYSYPGHFCLLDGSVGIAVLRDAREALDGIIAEQEREQAHRAEASA